MPELVRYKSADAIIAELQTIDRLIDFENRVNAVLKFAKDKETAETLLWSQVAIAKKLPSALKAGEIKTHGKGGSYALSSVDSVISCCVVDGWRKLAKVPAAKLRQYIEQSKKPSRAGALKWWNQQQAAVERSKLNGNADDILTSAGVNLFLGDLSEVGSEIPDESIDCIITDPPYPEEFLHTFSTLSQFASRVLKPDSSLICMSGQSYLPEVIQRLSEHLTYHWTCAIMVPGGQASHLFGRNVNCFWKPLLWFTKGSYKGKCVGDVCKSKVNDNDKEHHHWGQSESGMRDIVERFTEPGWLVCDPFLGGGTTGVVCLATDRKFIGIDIDSTALRSSKERMASVV